jgi:hypothetical protein
MQPRSQVALGCRNGNYAEDRGVESDGKKSSKRTAKESRRALTELTGGPNY